MTFTAGSTAIQWSNSGVRPSLRTAPMATASPEALPPMLTPCRTMWSMLGQRRSNERAATMESSAPSWTCHPREVGSPPRSAGGEMTVPR